MLAAILLALQPAPDLPGLIAQLGQPDGIKAIAAIDDRFGCDAVPLLVRNLWPVEIRHIPANAIEHFPGAGRFTDTIAALRIISGRDFTARLRPADLTGLTGVGRRFLVQNLPPAEVKPFAMWESRGSFYFPSVASQREVIAQWRAFARSGTCRHWSDPNKPVSFWYYGDPDAGPGR
jgi:hypothetical protein